MKKVLYIALEFPPQNNTGTYRTLKFVKYLPEYGVEPIVLTLTTESSEAIFGAKLDYKLLDELNGIEIHRVPARTRSQPKYKLLNYFRIFFRLHDKIVNNWEREAKKKIQTLISIHNPAAVIITFPPFSCFRLVNYIKKKFDVRIIVDFRDAWSAWGNNFFPTYFHFKSIQKLEKRVFEKADTIITVTAELKEKFIQIHGEQLRNKIEVISNGFDAELKSAPIKTTTLNNSNQLRIGYIGSFYYDPKLDIDTKKAWYRKKLHQWWQYSLKEEDWKYRSPFFFLKAFSEILKETPEYKSKIIFEHIGYSPKWLFQMVSDFKLENNFRTHGFLTQNEVRSLANEFDYLLATSEKNLVGPHYCLPSKIFDYIELNKPIIAFVTNGSQKIFLEKSGVAVIVNPDGLIKKNLLRVLSQNKTLIPNIQYLSNFSRKNLSANLSIIIDMI